MASANLEFKNGEAVLLYHDEDDRKRYWVHGIEEFHRAHFYPTHIEFRQLTPDGEDLHESGRSIESEFQRAPIRALAQVSFSRAVLYEGSEDWVWYADAVPLTDTMNRFRQSVLQPKGAHGLPLRLLDGDGPDDKFTVHTIAQSIADGYFPVSTTARYFHHDMDDHGFGIAALDQTSVDVVREMCEFALDLETTDKEQARQLQIFVASALDYYTYQRFFVEKMIPHTGNPLLGSILARDRYLQPRHDNYLRYIISKHGMEAKVDGSVNRPPEVDEYYQRVKGVTEQPFKFPL